MPIEHPRIGIDMSFCEKCGVKNDEDALYCKGCGAQVSNIAPPQPSTWEPRRGRARGFSAWPIFWGLIIIIFGLWVAIEFGLKHIEGVPDWITNLEFCWILPVIIGVLIILAGLRILINLD
jgi:hypothetical protein